LIFEKIIDKLITYREKTISCNRRTMQYGKCKAYKTMYEVEEILIKTAKNSKK
jgi:hypothetical protein